MKWKQIIEHVLQIVISILIAVEVSYEPNPYIQYLIITLVVYILFKNNNSIEKLVDKYL